MHEGMTIGRLAKAAGVNVETIRYYQRRRLIVEPHKPPGGHRRYPSAVLDQLEFIRRAQQLGFSLEEVKRLLHMADGRSCRDTRLMAEAKLEVLDLRIAQLKKVRRDLERLVVACRASRGRGFCPIIAALLPAAP